MLTDDVDVPDAYQNTLCPTIASNDEMSRRSVFDDSKVLCYIHAINLNPLTLHLYTFLEINCVFIYRKRILRSYTANTQHLLSAEIKTAKRRQTCKSFNYVLFHFNPNTTFTSWMSFEHIYF